MICRYEKFRYNLGAKVNQNKPQAGCNLPALPPFQTKWMCNAECTKSFKVYVQPSK